MYHNYSKKPASFWESPVDPAVKALDTEMTHNRVRLRVGLGFKGPVDGFELDKYKFGTARTFQQFMKFANMTFDGWMNETNSCGQLHWVPYSNATEVEDIVGGGWKMQALSAAAPAHVAFPTPMQHVPTRVARVMEEMAEEEAEDGVKQRFVSAHMKNGAGIGDEKPQQFRQGPQYRRRRSNAPAWGLLGVVVVALFVTLSNDSRSKAIRQACVARAPHMSHD
ncbi:hypothetical protein PHMEG_00040912 [Phytophthora megakarya]|uniref:Uncharacterized protein n=1 Tax=Phytophthora megakarya TaxID=4795 RepID=A0A225UDW7_9STRA|nr:hypothetical protein PHMEG_00040912 [Phytophthora megakarya]